MIVVSAENMKIQRLPHSDSLCYDLTEQLAKEITEQYLNSLDPRLRAEYLASEFS